MCKIHTPQVTCVLLSALSDNEPDVRRLAAETLIAIGEPAVIPLLLWLRIQPMTWSLCEGAQYVLHGWIHRHRLTRRLQQIVAVVLATLRDIASEWEMPRAPEMALQRLPVLTDRAWQFRRSQRDMGRSPNL